jgi:hypothetical protein
LVKVNLNRLAADGSSGGLTVHGPRTWFPISPEKGFRPRGVSPEMRCCPYSAAFSPDGRRLYLAGFLCTTDAIHPYGRTSWLPGVACLEYEGDVEPKVFAGTLKTDEAITPGVACDRRGNVYLTDYTNDRIQVYSPDATLLKTLPAKKPVSVALHPQTGEIYVFSWILDSAYKEVPATLNVMSPFEAARTLATYPLPGISSTV